MIETSSEITRKYLATLSNLRTSWKIKKMISNAHMRFGQYLENFQKSSEILGKPLKSQSFCWSYNKQNITYLHVEM